MATCAPQDLLDSATTFSKLTEKELDVVIIQLLRQLAADGQTVAQLREASKCMLCLDTKQIMTIQAQLLCNIA